MHIMACDVARAYFQAPNTSPVFVELCEEDRRLEDEELCGELSVSMYGTRSAACMFRHQERDIVVMVHGDDFVSTADIEDQRWLESMRKEKFETTTDIIGHEEEKKQINVLNRFILVEDGGYT